MSKTLKQLFDENGSVWLADKQRPNEKCARPLGYTDSDPRYIVCEVYKKSPILVSENWEGYVLYTEQKKKTKKYLWAYKTISDPKWQIVDTFFDTENSLKLTFSPSSITKVMRLDWSETDFEE